MVNEGPLTASPQPNERNKDVGSLGSNQILSMDSGGERRFEHTESEKSESHTHLDVSQVHFRTILAKGAQQIWLNEQIRGESVTIK